MNVYTCIDHEGHWAVPVASIVIAETEQEARKLLVAELAKEGLDRLDFTLNRVELDNQKAIILSNGEY